MRFSQPFGDAIHLRLGLLDRGSFAEATHRVEHAHTAMVEQLAHQARVVRQRLRHRRRYEELRATERRSPSEPARRDPDDGEVTTVQADGVADDAGVGSESIAPQRVAQHHDRVSPPRVVFIRTEETPRGRPQPEHVEIARSDVGAEDLFRLFSAGEVEAAEALGR